MEETFPVDIKTKIENDLVNFRKIRDVEKNLELDRVYMINNNMVNTDIYKEIDNELNSYNLLCNGLFQLIIPSKSILAPLLNEKRIGCDYNVLSFLGIISEKSARAAITCMDVDTGLTMSNMKNIIVKNLSLTDSLQIYRVPLNVKNLKNLLYNNLMNNHGTIVRLYQNQNDIMGHTVIFYKDDNRFIFIDPQQHIYAVFDYVDGKFILTPWEKTTNTNLNFDQTVYNLNTYVAFEFFTANMKLEALPQPKKVHRFEPMVITEDIPFHMFLFVAHGESIYSDKTKTSLKFPFHSLGFYVQKNLILNVNLPHIKMQDIVDSVSSSMTTLGFFKNKKNDSSSSPELSDVIVNNTGEIDVYPMNWAIEEGDYKAEFMGLYHLLYNESSRKFQIVNTIFDYNYFIDKTTGQPRRLYYSDIIKKCNNYYSENRKTLFKRISRKLIYMGIFSCRNPVKEYLHLASPETVAYPNINKDTFNLKQHIITRKEMFGGELPSPKFKSKSKSKSKIEMVDQDEFFKYIIEDQNQKANAISQSPVVSQDNMNMNINNTFGKYDVSAPMQRRKPKTKRTRKNKSKRARKSVRKYIFF